MRESKSTGFFVTYGSAVGLLAANLGTLARGLLLLLLSLHHGLPLLLGLLEALALLLGLLGLLVGLLLPEALLLFLLLLGELLLLLGADLLALGLLLLEALELLLFLGPLFPPFVDVLLQLLVQLSLLGLLPGLQEVGLASAGERAFSICSL